MSEWLDQAIARGQSIDDGLTAKRRQSLALLKTAQWPNRKVEAWRYTPVRALEKALAEISTSAPAGVATSIDRVDPIGAMTCLDFVFVDGRLFESLSANQLPVGVSVTPLAEAADWIADTFATIKPQHHLFGLVNDVLAENGVVIDVPAGVRLVKPIRLLNLVSAGVESHTRVIVRLGEGAQATVIEQFGGRALSVSTHFAEYQLAPSAHLEHYRLGLQTDQAVNIGGCHFRLDTQAQLDSHMVGLGSDLSRTDVDVIHAGENARARLNAIYLLQGQELFDLHSNIEHRAPHCTTEENVRGIVADRSRAVFNGRIHIHRHAQKTLAELNNRNLLLSDKAEVDTKPELEIYADDVKCAHGATVAKLDESALYYMQSRGIDPTQARVMLTFGFIDELVAQMPNQTLAKWLRPLLQERFAQMQTVD